MSSLTVSPLGGKFDAIFRSGFWGLIEITFGERSFECSFGVLQDLGGYLVAFRWILCE